MNKFLMVILILLIVATSYILWVVCRVYLYEGGWRGIGFYEKDYRDPYYDRNSNGGSYDVYNSYCECFGLKINKYCLGGIFNCGPVLDGPPA